MGHAPRPFEALIVGHILMFVIFSQKLSFLGIDAKRGEWISLDLTRRHFYDKLELVLEVDQQMEAILRKSVYESSEDGATWVRFDRFIECEMNRLFFIRLTLTAPFMNSFIYAGCVEATS